MRTALALSVFLAGCSTIGHTPPPDDWPALTIRIDRVSNAQMRETCMQYMGPLMSPEGCAQVYFGKRLCVITVSADYPQERVLQHEREHCAGKDHPTDRTLGRAWEKYKRER